ncbi:hypothetical protein VTK73DRAFT_3263 [Phialemonium thermophilum]|uniref:Uncharacterized protein n=1 Tax=Phialemonium thermophilum TaxID=223376 RepID=A0ABR3Y8C1_9PEZI
MPAGDYVSPITIRFGWPRSRIEIATGHSGDNNRGYRRKCQNIEAAKREIRKCSTSGIGYVNAVRVIVAFSIRWPRGPRSMYLFYPFRLTPDKDTRQCIDNVSNRQYMIRIPPSHIFG